MDIYKAIKKRKITFENILNYYGYYFNYSSYRINVNWINNYILYKLCDFY